LASGGRFIARGGTLVALEGEWRPRVVIFEFDDLPAATRWYHSPGYQPAKALRHGAASMRIIAVETT
jgi:uncharacterized protein (DUF1330 family)